MPESQPRILLASASPRRSELLRTIGVEFEVVAGADVDEAAVLSDAVGTLRDKLMHLARLKGAEAAQASPAAAVISADTVVVLGDSVMGKPKDAEDAAAMLGRLAGVTHEVYTAVAVRCVALGVDTADCKVTRVVFKPLSGEIIQRYIERAQPFDKAGSYAIQGLGALLVERIEGDYSNVVGLPLGLTARLLTQAGVQVL